MTKLINLKNLIENSIFIRVLYFLAGILIGGCSVIIAVISLDKDSYDKDKYTWLLKKEFFEPNDKEEEAPADNVKPIKKTTRKKTE